MIRRALSGVGLAIAIAAAPGVALADAAGPTDYETEIVEVAPMHDALTVSIVGGDAFVRAAVAEGHELVVLGYAPDEEAYLRIGPDGVVEQNVRSFATYYNAERYGSDDIPETVDTRAAPEWERIGSGGSWSWHDHRAHWMGAEPPVGLEPGDSLPRQDIPVLVDGERVVIGVVTTLRADPSIWPAVLGVLVGLSVALLAMVAGPATATLGAGFLALLALVVGTAQFLSLPSSTGPLTTWWLLPAIAAACVVVTIAIYGRSYLLERALVALAGALLVVWAWQRRDGLTRAILPTDLAFWFDRLVTSASLVGGALIASMSVWAMFSPPPSRS